VAIAYLSCVLQMPYTEAGRILMTRRP
jgi:hypothetical protein